MLHCKRCGNKAVSVNYVHQVDRNGIKHAYDAYSCGCRTWYFNKMRQHSKLETVAAKQEDHINENAIRNGH